jgi:hypothetical protein
MKPPVIPDSLLQAGMQRLVDEGRAEWTTANGERALRLTALGKALLRQPRAPETVQ